MTEGDVAEARSLISACSEFPGESGTVSIESKYGKDWTWGRVSSGWQLQIHRRVLSRYKEWMKLQNKPLDMFDAPAPDAPESRRAGKGARKARRYTPGKPYDESAVAGKTMPTGEGYDNGSDLPF